MAPGSRRAVRAAKTALTAPVAPVTDASLEEVGRAAAKAVEDASRSASPATANQVSLRPPVDDVAGGARVRAHESDATAEIGDRAPPDAFASLETTSRDAEANAQSTMLAAAVAVQDAADAAVMVATQRVDPGQEIVRVSPFETLHGADAVTAPLLRFTARSAGALRVSAEANLSFLAGLFQLRAADGIARLGMDLLAGQTEALAAQGHALGDLVHDLSRAGLERPGD